jgi:L-lactate dehydrogenase complex protein LldE
MRASLFITCYNDTLFPETGRAVVKLLEKLGVELDFHPSKPAAGRCTPIRDFEARLSRQAKRFVRMYQDTETVVIPSSSCVAMIRDQYPGLFESWATRNCASSSRRCCRGCTS